MSTADEPITTDGKAGYSSWCRRDQHRSCESAGARCTCRCHPAPRVPKEILMPEPHLAPVPDPVELACPEPGCSRTFDRAQALGRHRSAAHGTPGKTSKAKTTRKTVGEKPLAPLASEPVELKDDRWALLVPHTNGTAAAVVSTEADAREMSSLIRTLGHEAFMFRLVDGADV